MELSYAQKQTIEHLDEGINQLVRLFMNCNTIKGRKYYENWLKYVVNTRSNIISEPINNLIAKAIINGGLVKRKVYNNKTDEWDTEYLPTDKHINKIYNIMLKKRINIFERENINVKIKENSFLLKCLMLDILYFLNTCYLNDTNYEFIFNKNKIKKLNEKTRFENNPTTVKVDFILKHDNVEHNFFKELYNTFDGEYLEWFLETTTYDIDHDYELF